MYAQRHFFDTPEETAPKALIGREQELATLDQLYEDGGIITIFGPPGVGKSTLLQAKHMSWPDTIWIDLTDLPVEQRIPSAILKALNTPMPEAPPEHLDQAIQAQLLTIFSHPSKQTLIFDNAEQHIDEIIELFTWLPPSATLVYVLGSRQRLAIEQELYLELTPLQLEAHADQPSPAAQLFLARSHRPANTPQRLKAIERIVHLLDGLPLAIELAAARTRQLNPEDLFDKLSHDQASRAAMLSLEQTIAHSWDALNEHERTAMFAVATARGSMDTLHLEQLLRAYMRDPLQTLDELERHAMIKLIDPPGGIRAQTLLSIRDFVEANFRKDHAEQAALIERQYCDLIADLADQRYTHCCGEVWSLAPEAFSWDQDNFERAYTLLEAAPDHEATLTQRVKLRLILSLIALRRSDFKRVITLNTLLAQDATNPDLDESLRISCIITSLTSHTIHWQNYHEVQSFEDRIALAKGWNKLNRVRYCTKLVYIYNEQRRSMEQLQTLIQELTALSRHLDNPFLEADVLLASSHHFLVSQQYAKGAALAQEARELAQRHGLDYIAARAVGFLSYAYNHLGRFGEGYQLLFEAASCFSKLNHVVAQAHMYRQIVEHCVEAGKLPDAKRALDQLEPLGIRHGLNWSKGMTHYNRGLIALEEESYEQAKIELERGSYQFSQGQRPVLESAAYMALALCALFEQDIQSAQEAYEQALLHKNSIQSDFARIMLAGTGVLVSLASMDLKKALAAYAEIEAICQGKEIDHLNIYASYFRCHIDAYEYNLALSQNKARKIKSSMISLLARLSPLLLPPEDQRHIPAPVARLYDLRVGLRLLYRSLPELIQRRIEVMLQDPKAQALLIDINEQAFRPPGEVEWVEMRNRHTPFRLLQTLVEHRLERPGEPLSAETLCEQVWPGEVIVADAAQNRLYVTIATLRRIEGMKDVIINEQSGYLVDPNLPLIEA